LLRPPQEHVALLVALGLALDVGGEGAVGAEPVHLPGGAQHGVRGRARRRLAGWWAAGGLIRLGSPARALIASRIAARSTTQGTPVKSCITTRAGRYWISRLIWRSFSQSTIACRSSRVTVTPSSKRSRFSSSTFIENGRRETSPRASEA